MYEFVKTEKGWTLYWGGAALHRETSAPAPVVRSMEPATDRQDEREPVKILSA
jgi:hypothetical protein